MLCCGPYVVLLKGPCGALALYMEEPLEEVPLVITVQFVPLRLSGIGSRSLGLYKLGFCSTLQPHEHFQHKHGKTPATLRH